jgi:Lrp/AsnC family transcriptional regulator for asnA, asnC and gidA
MLTLDKTDTRIIEMLEADGRKSFTEIAQKLDVSESAVRKRVSTLLSTGVIKGFTVKLDHTKLGLNTVAIVGVDVEPDRMLEVAQLLCDLKEVKCVATSSGDHMIMLEVWAPNGKELNKLISGKISTVEGVKKVCPALILEKLKE